MKTSLTPCRLLKVLESHPPRRAVITFVGRWGRQTHVATQNEEEQ